MSSPLLITGFLHRARALLGEREIVEYRAGAQVHRYTYREYHARVVRLAGALVRLGVRPADRVATLAWNTTGTSSSTSRSRWLARCCTPSTSAWSRRRSPTSSSTPRTASSSPTGRCSR